MVAISRELEDVLDGRRLGALRVILGVANGVAGDPAWEISDSGVLCLTWQRGGREVVMLMPPRGKPVLYRGQLRIPNAAGSELSDAIRWMRA